MGCVLGLRSEKMGTNKHSKNIPAKKSRGPSKEIRAWILWSLKTIQRSQIQGLANLTQGLETLHWCLAARWRILGNIGKHVGEVMEHLSQYMKRCKIVDQCICQLKKAWLANKSSKIWGEMGGNSLGDFSVFLFSNVFLGFYGF